MYVSSDDSLSLKIILNTIFASLTTHAGMLDTTETVFQLAHIISTIKRRCGVDSRSSSIRNDTRVDGHHTELQEL